LVEHLFLESNRPNGEEVANMNNRITFGAILLLLPLAALEVVHGRPDRTRDSHTSSGARRDGRLGSQTKPVATDEERDKLLATGKKIFVERCAKCHDERGDKSLKTGVPLSQRELSDEELTRAVSGRLKGAPDEEKRGVALYVSSFMKRK
jgi:mono/diheme cytochrome c family protein